MPVDFVTEIAASNPRFRRSTRVLPMISAEGGKVRNVPAEMKREVYREYGIISHGPGDYEIDHLIPLELGGSNSIKISGQVSSNLALEWSS